MLKKIKSRRGETMIEVLVALAVLILGIVGSLRLVGMALQTNTVAFDRVIATNLAREGIEATRNIRDTNWLRFAGERRKCWNNLEVGICTGSDYIKNEQAYAAEFDETNWRWSLKEVDTRMNLENAAESEEFRVWQDANSGIFNSAHESGDEASKYFREIFFEYVSDDGNGSAPASRLNDSCSGVEDCGDALRVTSRVSWLANSGTKEVTLTTILTDYFGRKNEAFSSSIFHSAASNPFIAADFFEDGVCGSADGENYYEAGEILISELCSAGDPSEFSGDGPWTWICHGIGGGAEDNCSVNLSQDAVAGPADGGQFASAAEVNEAGLCSVGSAPAVSGSGPWSWTCEGANGGADVNCSAQNQI